MYKAVSLSKWQTIVQNYFDEQYQFSKTINYAFPHTQKKPILFSLLPSPLMRMILKKRINMEDQMSKQLYDLWISTNFVCLISFCIVKISFKIAIFLCIIKIHTLDFHLFLLQVFLHLCFEPSFFYIYIYNIYILCFGIWILRQLSYEIKKKKKVHKKKIW